MLILLNEEGQLGNRLLVSAHIYAYAIENSEALIDINLGKYSTYFKKIKGKKICRIDNIVYKRFIKFMIRIMNLTNRAIFNYHAIGWVHKELCTIERRKNDLLILNGVGFRDTLSLKKNKSELLEFFMPKNYYEESVAKIISKLKSEYDCLVGIHIRWGDYKTWQGGKYYYELDYYDSLINYLNNSLLSGMNVGFYVCSNEFIDVNLFNNKDVFSMSLSEIEDLLILSKCDYIVGPPSTFSMWASFYGQTLLYHLQTEELNFELSSFYISNL